MSKWAGLGLRYPHIRWRWFSQNVTYDYSWANSDTQSYNRFKQIYHNKRNFVPPKLQIGGDIHIIFLTFLPKTYVVGTHKKRLTEALQTSTTTYVLVKK